MTTRNDWSTIKAWLTPGLLTSGEIMHRKAVNKHKSAKKFRANTHHTKALNMKGAPMRGGIRL